MAYATPAAADLSTYLGADTTPERAELFIGLAEKLCRSVVTPLPDGAEAVVLDVAARAFSNPQNVTSQAAGPYLASYGAVGGGLWLTARNEATLRRLAGTGGAFTIDPTPADASAKKVWGQIPADPADPYPAPFYDWDVTP